MFEFSSSSCFYLLADKTNKKHERKPCLICICKQRNFFPGFIKIQVKETKFYLLKLLNQISPLSLSILGTACLIICEISLFVSAANREAILLVTYTTLASLARSSWR